MSSGTGPSLSNLLEQQDWIRALAHRIAGEQALAEDLAQAASVEALRLSRPPEAPARKWLARVMRNLAHQWKREERHRGDRELIAARHDRVRSTEEIVMQASSFKCIAEAVFELPPRYRDVILLRFFEDLPPRRIAIQLDLPVSTVKTRLQRAIQRLRDTLGEECEYRSGLWAAFTPRLRRPRESVATLLGSTDMKLVAAMTSILLGATLYDEWTEPRSGPVTVASTPTATRADRDAPPIDTNIRPPGREELAAREPARHGATAAVQHPATRTARGRALDIDGRPLPGLLMRAKGESSVATSGADGWFELEVTHAEVALVCANPGWVTISTGIARNGATLEASVIAAPAVPVAGRVLDTLGRPLEGARVGLELPAAFPTRFDRPLANSLSGWWSVTTDAEGRFELAACPVVSHAELSAFLVGYQPTKVPAPSMEVAELRIELAPAEMPDTLAGHVVTPAGDRIPGAWVSAGLATVSTNEDGVFLLDRARMCDATEIIAVARGHLPARFKRRHDNRVDSWPDFIELMVGPPSLMIEGVVVDTAGQPLSGVQVWIDDPSVLGPIVKTPLTVEGIMSGAEVVPELLGSYQGAPVHDGDATWRQARVLGAPSATFAWTHTDGNGRFRLTGLLERDYIVKALDPETLQSVTTKVTAGVRGTRLALATDALFTEVVGTVVDEQGRPLIGATVLPFHEAYHTTSRVLGGKLDLTVWRVRPSVLTDDAGRFRFTSLPIEGVVLRVESDRSVTRDVALHAGLNPTSVAIELQTRRHFRLELDEPRERADAVAARDVDGRFVHLYDLRPNHHDLRMRFPVEDGLSPPIAVGPEAVELVLFHGPEEVGRVPLELVPGGVSAVRW